MGIKIYLDDERAAPEGWVRAYWPSEVINLLKTEDVEEISLDHDLGSKFGDNIDLETGYQVLLWIEEQVILHKYKPPKIRIHTANPPARQKMLAAVDSIMKRVENGNINS